MEIVEVTRVEVTEKTQTKLYELIIYIEKYRNQCTTMNKLTGSALQSSISASILCKYIIIKQSICIEISENLWQLTLIIFHLF